MNESYIIIEKLTTVYKIIFLGTSGVGKTTAVKGLFYESINQPIYPITPNKTQFIDFSTIQLTESKILQIWDITYQTNKISILLDHKTLYSNASLIILMFAINDLNSYLKLINNSEYLDFIQTNSIIKTIPILLIGNKIDKHYEINNTTINQLLYKYPQIRMYLPISAITKEGITSLKNSIMKYLNDELANKSLKFTKRFLYNFEYQLLENNQSKQFLDINLDIQNKNFELNLKSKNTK